MSTKETQAKHTPGPWTYREVSEYDHTHGPFNRGTYGLVECADYVIVNGCAPGGEPERQKANARLIAAAPDLLEALMRVWQAGMEPKPRTMREWKRRAERMAEYASAAIARAEGC